MDFFSLDWEKEIILLADTAKEFAEKVILLLKDEILRKKIGGNGRNFVMKNYTWANADYQFEKVYQEAINQFHKLKNET